MSILFKTPEEKHINLLSRFERKNELFFLKKNSKEHIPKSILLQWHITENCNLRCSHCYQEAYSSKELSFNDCKKVIIQFKNLINYFSKKTSRKIPAHITITGGEPFVRKDFFKLLNLFYKNREYFTYAILSNGTFIDESVAKKLSTLSPSFVQISIEGTKNTHDQIRGIGNYDKAVLALENLVKNNIPSMISFTAHKKNYKEFDSVVSLGDKIGVSRIWSDRLIPCGSGALMDSLMLSPNETKEFFEIMKKSKIKLGSKNKTEVAMHRALQFLIGGGKPYYCTAGDSLITIQANGDLLPCRRMPVVVGNVLDKSIKELYCTSDFFKKLRNTENINDSCKACIYSKLCKGGLRCLSFASTKDPFSKDPGCWV